MIRLIVTILSRFFFILFPSILIKKKTFVGRFSSSLLFNSFVTRSAFIFISNVFRFIIQIRNTEKIILFIVSDKPIFFFWRNTFEAHNNVWQALTLSSEYAINENDKPYKPKAKTIKLGKKICTLTALR